MALEVLSKIPKVSKKSGSSPLSKASSKANVSANQPLENGTRGGGDWDDPATAAHAWGGNDSGGLDWSQPVVQVEKDELKLDWGDDKDDDDDEDGEGLTMKKPEQETKAGSKNGVSKLQREDSQVPSNSLQTFVLICLIRNCCNVYFLNDQMLLKNSMAG